ncbi:MAG: transporter substrate-binding domain-containing protein [Rhodospirillales bacterium]|nr:transporter substrate-binding domain-containing protein [Rhodospirillales bacterium]
MRFGALRVRFGRGGMFGAIAAALLLLAGAVPARAEDLLARIKASKVLVIGTSNDAPLSYVSPGTHKALGALPDILREFLRREGIAARLEVTAMPFSSLLPALQSGRIELMGDAMYIRPARAKIVDFTDVVFYNPESLDVPKGNPKNLHSLAALCGHSAGTYEGTTYADLLKSASAACPAGKRIDIKLYPTIQNVFADLNAGRLDAAVVDASLSAYALKQNPALGFELVANYEPQAKATSDCAFAVAKGNPEFLRAFNATYAAMLKDGTAARIFAKWGLTPTNFFLKL